MIIAKPVVANQYWILQENEHKVGNIQAGPNGYTVTLQNQIINYKTLPMMRKAVEIEFTPPEKKSRPVTDFVHGYPTGCKAHNGMWDIKRKLPLFTKLNKSKSWFAAGWYQIKQHRNWKTIQNPKLILLERYAYRGPFTSKDPENHSNFNGVNQ
jgi:hypothetical protein